MTIDDALGEHVDRLYATARVLAGNAAHAEDLVQETAIAAFQAWGQLRSHEAVRPWLLRILMRTLLNSRRYDSRRPPIVDIDIDDLIGSPLLSVEPERSLGFSDLSDDVAAAFDELPVGFREVVWLIDAEELTLGETAEALDLPVGTVASRVHRARRLLRERLSGRREEEV